MIKEIRKYYFSKNMETNYIEIILRINKSNIYILLYRLYFSKIKCEIIQKTDKIFR